MRIRVDHRAPRQLVAGGPWIFWRQRSDGAREGLVLELLPCDNRRCECRDVRVIGQIVDESLAEIEATRDGLVLTYRGRTSATSQTHQTTALVSFETGEVQVAAEGPEAADHDHDHVLTWIADELDGELLDGLYDEWLHAKAWRRRDTPHEGAWAGEWTSDRGRLVGWHEVFPDSRQDMYLIDGSVSLALDHYCINPTCTCREVRVALLAPGRSRRWAQFGDILFDLASLSATRLSPFTQAKAPLVSAMRAAFEARYDVIEHFSRRLDRLKEVGRLLKSAGPAPPTPFTVSGLAKAGRNDPCPCGSGRKYKKCCLHAAANS
jgi:SEC-C motif